MTPPPAREVPRSVHTAASGERIVALRESLADASDELLAARAADGDTVAFDLLVRRHAPFLRAYAIRLTGSRADADDAVQETLIAAWQRIDRLADPAAVRGWLASILSRKATDRMRRRRPTDSIDDVAERLPADPEGDPARVAEGGSRLAALDRVLRRLPPGQRACWLLREVSGYSYEEIADRLGVPPATVRGRLARARETVMIEMEGWR